MYLLKNVGCVYNCLLKTQKNTFVFRQLQNSAINLAGHSKWANIKHIKAQKDGQRATLFTRIARQIRLAIQEGGSPDPALNSQLKSVIDDALRKSMPMATIQNNIKKSQQTPTQLKRYLIELRYKQKVFAVCVIFTDNLPGVKMNIAPILRKAGAIQQEVSHLFDEFGLIETICSDKKSDDLEEYVTEVAIECGAEEVEIVDAKSGIVNFTCSPIEMNMVRNALEKKGFQIESTEHLYVPHNTIQLTEDELNAYNKFVQKLRDIPGLEDVYDNIEL